MKVVLDVNILLQSLGKSSIYRPIWQSYLHERFLLLTSTSILLEYEEKISEKTTQTVALNVMELIGEAVNTEFVPVYYEWNAITKDPDDNKYFDTAVSGNADYIVTNDNHFNEVKRLQFPSIQIISGDKFLNVVNSL